METCETVELLRIEGKYLYFIVELSTEIKILEHARKCEECREWIRNNIDGDDIHELYGNLFDTTVYDPIVPKYSDYEDLESFVDGRIDWRIERLENLYENAEMELQDLRKRLE
jgi:hypothetical protein